MVVTILKVFLSYSQVHIVTPKAITKSSSSYGLIWICENIALLLCPNGILLPADDGNLQ